MSDNQIPDFVKPCLWSYDTSKMELEEDKKTIIFGILNHGGEEALIWLLKNYSETDIKLVIENTPESAWYKKSINFCKLIFDVIPKHKFRFIPNT